MISDVLSDAHWNIAQYLTDDFYRNGNFVSKMAVVRAFMDELRTALDAGKELKNGSTPLIEEFLNTHEVSPLVALLERTVDAAREAVR